MPRIVGVDVPAGKRIELSLTYIYGIGRVLSNRLLSETKIDPNTRAKDLTDEEVARLQRTIQTGYKVEGDLRRDVSAGIKRLIDIASYRGSRHKRGLPVRGQRTKTNSRTRKGPRPRVGVRKRNKQTTAS